MTVIPRLCTTRSRYEEFNKVQVCRYHEERVRSNNNQPKVRKLGSISVADVLSEKQAYAVRQCSKEVHYYLKNLFDEAQHSRTTRANLKPILSAKTEPSKTPPYRDHKPDRVTFSAFGLPKQRERVKRHTLPDLPLKDEGKVFIKLSRPSACPDFSSMRTEYSNRTTSRDIYKKQTFRPFCLIQARSAKGALGSKVTTRAPPSSPQVGW